MLISHIIVIRFDILCVVMLLERYKTNSLLHKYTVLSLRLFYYNFIIVVCSRRVEKGISSALVAKTWMSCVNEGPRRRTPRYIRVSPDKSDCLFSIGSICRSWPPRVTHCVFPRRRAGMRATYSSSVVRTSADQSNWDSILNLDYRISYCFHLGAG